MLLSESIINENFSSSLELKNKDKALIFPPQKDCHEYISRLKAIYSLNKMQSKKVLLSTDINDKENAKLKSHIIQLTKFLQRSSINKILFIDNVETIVELATFPTLMSLMTYLIKNKEYKIEFPHKDDLLLLLFDDNFGVELLKNIHAKIMHRNILDDNANYIRCFRLYEKIILYKKNNANTFNEVSFLYQNPDEAASLLRIYCGFGDSEWVDDLMVSHSSLTEDEFHERLKLLAQCSFNVLSSEDLIYGSSIKKADKMVVTLIFPTKKQRENYLFRYEQESKIIENEMQISINNNNVKEKIKKDNNLSKYMILFLVVCYVLVGK